MVRQMGLGKNIKILLIEDNSGDAYLIEEQLEELANFFYEIKNVGTLRAYPKSPAALNVIHAHAKCNIAR